MALRHRTAVRILLWTATTLGYLWLIAPRLSRPITGWEALVWDIPFQIATAGYKAVRFFYLPPLYDSIIAVSLRIFGISEAGSRIPGVVFCMVMPAIVYHMAQEISEKKNGSFAALAACAFFLTSPLMIQGSLVIDRSDTTALLFFLSLFYLALFKTEGLRLVRRTMILGPLFAVCLWAKVTTPLACLIAVPAAYLLCGRFREGAKISAAVFGAGIALFFVTWGAFCGLVAGISRFFEPFGYYGKAASDSVAAFSPTILSRVPVDIFRISLWLSPFLLILLSLALYRSFTGRRSGSGSGCKEMHMATFISVVFAGYLCANATFSGFPKYICPAVPMIACVVAKFVCRQAEGLPGGGKRSAILFLCLFAGAAYYMIFVKDWVYATYILRSAGIAGGIRDAVRGVLWQQALYLALPVVIFVLYTAAGGATFTKKISVSLAISVLAGNAALDITQRNAAYSVSFGYGTEGAEGVRRFLREKRPAHAFSSIEGYFANVGDTRFCGIDSGTWDDSEKMSELFDEYRPECLIYGLAANTVSQLTHTIKAGTVESRIRNEYDKTVIGSYNVLMRKRR